MGATALIGLALAALVAGCGSEPEQLSPACSAGPDEVTAALAEAPGAVALAGGTLLSECVSRATDDADLQMVGFALTPAADALANRPDERSALRLGFLVGAVRRGASASNGVSLELVRRMESRVRYDDPALLEAAERGARAGEDHG
ncbi:MAG: hypothetical protein ABIO51_03875 [Solirubrobacteraceae bacterium]